MPKLLDLVKAFERNKQKYALASLFCDDLVDNVMDGGSTWNYKIRY